MRYLSPTIMTSVQFNHSVVSDSLQPHGWQHTRPPCPSPTPGVHPNSCASSRWWCHPAISSCVILFSSCPQSLPASGSFPMSQFFTSCDQSIGASASVSGLPMNIQDWFPLGLTGLMSSIDGWTVNFQTFKLDLEKAEEPEIKLSTSNCHHQKSKRVPEKHLFLLYWLCQSLWLCGSQQTVENSSRDGNTRPPYLPPEK